MRDILLSFRYRTDCMPFLLGVALYALGKNDNSYALHSSEISVVFDKRFGVSCRMVN